MKKTLAFLVSLFIFFVFANLSAQAQAGGDVLPHVSQIRAEVRNNLVRLTWTDSPDAWGPVFIFRSTRPFAGTVPVHIRPVVVEYGTQSFIDDTDGLENLYYFIAASDLSGRRFDVIIPRVNTTSLNEPVVQTPPAPLPVIASPSLRVSQEGDRVIITYDSSALWGNVILYRSMQPIRQPHDLLNAVIVQSAFVSPFVDYPVPGITWYYAVLHENDISAGNIRIIPGVNATVSPVLIAAEHIERSLRPIPLPELTLRTVPERTPLRAETRDLIRNMQIPPRVHSSERTPRIFWLDLQPPASGEESTLYQIVNDYFGNNWERARDSLRLFLSLPRSNDVELRARFYLAQALYFTGSYREALLEFLSVRSHIPEEANIWINAALSAMVQ